MKWIKRIFISLVFVVIVLPMVFFNFKKDAVSEIDNRMLADNPFEQEGDLTENLENYVNDRIGFRNDMILGYTVLNDKLFGKMVHPSYTYGKDGYIFGAGLTVDNPFTDYHVVFADMVKKIQDYCEVRGIPFLFVFNPAKPAVYSEYIAAGINYDRAWVDRFFEELDARGVRYVNNTSVLIEQKNAGEIVFNQKFDANHWNDLGAYYGTKAALTELQKDFPAIRIEKKEDLTIDWWTNTSLLVSKFPIDEKAPYISIDTAKTKDVTASYNGELEVHSSFRHFSHTVNEAYTDAPKALVFQGSYMDGSGARYFANGFGEYIAVHDYQNVIDFPYYFNIFQPECVVFEVAEYTFSNYYFSWDNMENMKLNKPITALSAEELASLYTVEAHTVERGEALTKIKCEIPEGSDCAWLQMDVSYDMQKKGGEYVATVRTEIYDEYKDTLKIASLGTIA